MSWQIERFLELAKDSVLEPDLLSGAYLLLISTINELTSIVPLGSILAGQILVYDKVINFGLASKMFWFVAVPVGVGVAFGSLLIYAIAYWGGKPAIEKFGKYIGIRWSKIKKIEEKMKKSRYDEVLFFGLRATPFFPNVPLTAAAGVLQMNIWTFVSLTALGTVVRMSIMMSIAALGGWGLL